jgi:hypothetical protein
LLLLLLFCCFVVLLLLGFLFPYFHAVSGTRVIFFGAHCCEKIFTNFGVLMGYFVICLILTWIMWFSQMRKAINSLAKPGSVLGDAGSAAAFQQTSNSGQAPIAAG